MDALRYFYKKISRSVVRDRRTCKKGASPRSVHFIAIENIIVNCFMIIANRVGAASIALSLLFGSSLPAQVPGLVEAGDNFGHALSTGDFNGDGLQDLVIGIAEQQIEGQDAAGAVEVRYGAIDGTLSTEVQLWHQNVNGLQDEAESPDLFGASLGVGDFNADGFDDLAIGVANEEIAGAAFAGALHVIYGSPVGLSADGAQFIHQGLASIDGEAVEGNGFARALATGDLDADGFDDLVVGVPGRDFEGMDDAGDVHVLYGSISGLDIVDPRIVPRGAVDGGERAGSALAVGDFDGDEFDDVAVGMPGDAVGEASRAGSVVVHRSTETRFALAFPAQLRHQPIEGAEEIAETNDAFGFSLAAGDFNDDGLMDLAVGIPFESVQSTPAAGAVEIFYGSAADVIARQSELWSQADGQIDDAPESFDRFGFALAAGDLTGDGVADLAIGVVGESAGTVGFAGAVNLLFGTVEGLNQVPPNVISQVPRFLHEDVDGIASEAASEENFGAALAIDDLDADGKGDLVIGVPLQRIGTLTGAGAAHVLPGSALGPVTEGSLFIRQPGLEAVDDERFLLEDATETFSVLSNDVFAGDGPGTLVRITQPAHGIVSVVGQDSLTYDPVPNFNGLDSLTYTALNTATGDSAQAIVHLTVLPVNDAPAFTSVPADTTIATGVTYSDTVRVLDVDDDPLDISVPSLPVWLSVDASAGNVAVLFGTPTFENVGAHQVAISLGDGTVQVDTSFTITVTATAPAAPELVAPADQAVDVRPTTVLVWRSAVAAQSYDVQVSLSGDFGVMLLDSTGVADTTITISDLTFETRYFWRVRAANVGGAGAFSDPFSFVTEPLRPPDAPVLLEPPNGATELGLSVVLEWQASERADAYEVQLSTAGDFSDIVVDTAGIAASRLAVSGLSPGITYFWRVRATNASGKSDFSAAFFSTSPTAVPTEEDHVPDRFELGSNYPNPFNPSTTIAYALASTEYVRLAVYDLSGREVVRLVDTRQPAGRYLVGFDASGLASGLYLYRIDAGRFSQTRRMTLLK